MEAIIIHPKNSKQLTALKIIFKEMRIPFEKVETTQKLPPVEESPYDPEFVAMVQQADKDFEEGKGKTMILDDIWK